eukprot:TRINITY_DN22654_c0_g2_i1.p1 TRINITY_DN22654_c0_g2~~TRINITY_DN22654_c0_g2_i1.p1  ORF type:complete len:110 (-),score=12.94 TRINITY_DN22654_c0_g2_i1:33-362(-)
MVAMKTMLAVVVALMLLALTINGCGCVISYGDKSCTPPAALTADCCKAQQDYAKSVCSGGDALDVSRQTANCMSSEDLAAMMKGGQDEEFQKCQREAVPGCLTGRTQDP